jgi:HEAT repeat protein
MESQYQKEYNFQEIKDALLNKDAPFPATLLYFFSDISDENLNQLKTVWPEVWTERRRGLLEDMEHLAEGDTLLFFDPVAIMGLGDADPVARATAIRLLWQSRKEKLVPKFMKLLKEDPESIVRAAAATALGNFVYLGELDEIKESTYQQLLESLIETHLSSDEDLVRRRALESLGYASHPDVEEYIQIAYDRNDEEWLQSALFAMGRSYNRRWLNAILRMFDHPDSLVRYEAVRAAGELEAEEAREPIFDLLEEGTDDEDLYFAAIWSLTKIGGEGVRELIETNLDETDDSDEILFLEEALENLDFTEQVNLFDIMYIEEQDPENWSEDDEDLLE